MVNTEQDSVLQCCYSVVTVLLQVFERAKVHVQTNSDTLSDFIWTEIIWTLEGLAFILMSVQIKSGEVVKFNT